MEDEAGNKDTEVEIILSRLEADARVIIDKVEDREPLSWEKRQNLALFVALLKYRVPNFER